MSAASKAAAAVLLSAVMITGSVFISAWDQNAYAASSELTGAGAEAGLPGTTADIQAATEVALDLYGDSQWNDRQNNSARLRKRVTASDEKSDDEKNGSETSGSAALDRSGENAGFAEALVQQCRYTEDSFGLNENSRFFIVTADSKELPPDEITDTVSLMASQFASYSLPTEQPLKIVYGTEDNAAEGDIVIKLMEEDIFRGAAGKTDAATTVNGNGAVSVSELSGGSDDAAVSEQFGGSDTASGSGQSSDSNTASGSGQSNESGTASGSGRSNESDTAAVSEQSGGNEDTASSGQADDSDAANSKLSYGIGDVDTADINETYRLETGRVTGVTACDPDGIYYGLLTLMEIAKENVGDRTASTGGSGSKETTSVGGSGSKETTSTGGSGSKESASTSGSGSKETASTDKADIAETALSEGADGETASITIPGLCIIDGPDLAERTVLLDCGRKYFSKEWIENFIKRASTQRYNTIVLHFSESEGLRLDSEKFPWLTENIDSLTRDEAAEIVRLAHRYHMDVIPSLDSPGHNRFIVRRYSEYVKKHPDFSFTCDGKTYDSSVSGFGSIANHYSHNGSTREVDYAGIDITRKHAVAFMYALADDYAEFFGNLGCDRFDIGGDEVFGWYSFNLGGDRFNYNNRWQSVEHWAEYARKKLGIKNGSASDTYINYLNKLAERLGDKGFRCRVFNDEIDLNSNQHIDLDESIDITFWINQGKGASHYAEKGHLVYNFVESWCFYVVRKMNGKDIMNSKYKTVNAKNIFENWEPKSFNRTPGKWRPVSDEAMGGAYFAIWCDHPDYKSRSVIWDETEYKTWASASRMWNAEVNSGKSGTGISQNYDDLKEFADMAGCCAGFTGDPENNADLPEPAEPESAASWWQELAAGGSYN